MLEMTTPTGAAIVRHYVKEKVLIPPLEVERIGYGFGS
jgi:pyridinium-3,5-bisthiocarboxylic acid mononucleotide nickel chelatase